MVEDDDVDMVIDAWADALPDVDFAPLDVVSRLRRLQPQLQEIRQNAFAANDLSTWEFEMLSMLRQQGTAGMTPSMLMDRLNLSHGNMANRLDRLAARSFITRERNPADARSKIVMLTPRGLERVDRAMRRLVDDENEVLADLSRDQVTTLIESLRVIATAVERVGGRRPDGPRLP